MAVSEERTRKRNKVIHSEARELISRVIQTCNEEARKKELAFPVSQATKRAVEYCGKSKTLIKKIRKEHKTRVEKESEEKLPMPGKKRNMRPENTKVQVDDFNKCVVRNIIHDFYATKKEVPTAAKLLPIITEKINFPWGRKSLNKGSEKHWLHMEEVRFKVVHFDRKTKNCLVAPQIFGANEKKEIFYLDESWIDSNITFSKCWQGETELGKKKKESREQTSTSKCRK
jgi:hypothetical protein